MLTLLSLILSASAPTALQDALQRQAPSGTRVEITGWKPSGGCDRGTFEAPAIEHSGRVPVKVRGASCSEWAWADVKLFTKAVITTRDVAEGGSFDGAWTVVEQEARLGHATLSSLRPGAVAARRVRANTPLTPEAVRLGPAPGTPVLVRVQVGALRLEQRATIVPCAAMRVCATTQSGKRLEGTWTGDALFVGELP